MKALILNLPSSQKIYRCYRCSINSPGFCLPPLELLYQAGVCRAGGVETKFIDAMADMTPLPAVIESVRQFAPDLVVSILGYEHFTEDVDAVNAIIRQASVPHYAVIGYLPSHYPHESLKHLAAEMILIGEPEQTLAEVIAALRDNRPLAGIAGLAVRQDGQVHVGPSRPRMTRQQLEALPLPARDMLDIGKYREPFLDRPFTTFQAGRGCPFRCFYCTSTYGSEFSIRSPEHVVAEIEQTRRQFGVSCFRFTDDTFAVSLPWTREFCSRLIATGHKYDWVALTRIDLMDKERMRLLSRAGCRRLFVGIESGSQKVLDYYHKRYKAADVPGMVANARRACIEVVGYFVVGSPIEDEIDYKQTLDMALRLRLDMASVYPMMPYPDTASFADQAEQVDFKLYPYSLTYRDKRIWQTAERRMRDMMSKLYLSPRFLAEKARWMVRYPSSSLEAGRAFAGWLLGSLHKKKRKTLL